MKNAYPTDEANQPAADQLLYSRKQAALLLGRISVFTLGRLEKEGVLRPVRLSRSPTAQVFYRRADLLALIEFQSAENSDHCLTTKQPLNSN